MEHSESILNIVPALIGAQRKYQKVKKTKHNTYHDSYYADLADYIEATLPALNDNGLTIIQGVDFTESQTVVHSALVHVSGEYFSETIHIPGKQEKAQDVVSASTYARRVQWTSLAGVAGEDDDGNAASKNNKQQPPKKEPPKVNQTPAQPTTAARPGEAKAAPANPKVPPQNTAIASPQADSAAPAETVRKTDDSAPYTKEEYNAEIVPRVKALYADDEAKKKDVIAKIKGAYQKETKDYTRAEWAELFAKLEAK